MTDLGAPTCRWRRDLTVACAGGRLVIMQTSHKRAAWKLGWNDDFDGDHTDPSKWAIDVGSGSSDHKHHAWIPGWGEGALQRDGAPLFTRRCGKFAFRVMVDWCQGPWPELCMLPQVDRHGGWAASSEVDVMEIIGAKPQEVSDSIHFASVCPQRAPVTHVHQRPGGGTVADWHVDTLERKPAEIRVYVDGVHNSTHAPWRRCGKAVWSGHRGQRLGSQPLAGAVRPTLQRGDERGGGREPGMWRLQRLAIAERVRHGRPGPA
jgi:beta-glucanase (GH16 family)